MTSLTPYILFDGTCEEAMQFYHACLGGDLVMTKVGESFLKDLMPPAAQRKVVNARLRGAAVDVSASDWMRADQTPVWGNTVCLYLSGGTRDDLQTVFDRLSVGAEVSDPLGELPFGLYGALNDRFGVRWMFHAE